MPTTESFDAGDARIVYDDLAPEERDRERPIVLLHGFASNRRMNWEDRGWYDALLSDGRRVIAPDCRGHGESDKPRDSAAYGFSTMAADIIKLLDHLEIDVADLLGYSMGGHLALELFQAAPERFNAGVLGGVGSTTFTETRPPTVVADALAADNDDDVSNHLGRQLRAFAKQGGNDLDALAACARAQQPPADREALADVEQSVLVIAGEHDNLAGDVQELAAAFPNGEAVVLPDANHMSALEHDALIDTTLEFLDREGL